MTQYKHDSNIELTRAQREFRIALQPDALHIDMPARQTREVNDGPCKQPRPLENTPRRQPRPLEHTTAWEQIDCRLLIRCTTPRQHKRTYQMNQYRGHPMGVPINHTETYSPRKPNNKHGRQQTHESEQDRILSSRRESLLEPSIMHRIATIR